MKEIVLEMNDNQFEALDILSGSLCVDNYTLLRLMSQWLCGFAPKSHRSDFRNFVQNSVNHNSLYALLATNH